MKMKNEDIVGSRVLLPVAKYLLICCYEMRLEIVLLAFGRRRLPLQKVHIIVVIVVHRSAERMRCFELAAKFGM